MFINAIDKLIDKVGQIASALSIVLALLTAIVVLFRYVLGGGSIALQESITYIHSAIFLLGASVGLKQAAHVRVDIFFRQMSKTQQAWVDSLGTLLFLLPVSVFIVVSSWHFVQASWVIKEVSADAGGLAYVYLLKTLIPIGASLLTLQGCAELARSIRQLTNGGHHND